MAICHLEMCGRTAANAKPRPTRAERELEGVEVEAVEGLRLRLLVPGLPGLRAHRPGVVHEDVHGDALEPLSRPPRTRLRIASRRTRDDLRDADRLGSGFARRRLYTASPRATSCLHSSSPMPELAPVTKTAGHEKRAGVSLRPGGAGAAAESSAGALFGVTRPMPRSRDARARTPACDRYTRLRDDSHHQIVHGARGARRSFARFFTFLGAVDPSPPRRARSRGRPPRPPAPRARRPPRPPPSARAPPA